ncbi:MAG TPA: BamA/TamA family outer membrane protein [Bacteroidota bacterium]|nr:BamA/TamA family outer membrane protein [Bacteroidota bacterium]
MRDANGLAAAFHCSTNPFFIASEKGFFVLARLRAGGLLRLLFLVFALHLAAVAQHPDLPPSTYEINAIEFKGNETFDSDALRNAIILKETPGGFSKFLYRTFGEKLGSKPEYFDNFTHEADRVRLTEFYQRQGFYQTAITDTFTVDTSSRRVDIFYSIQENKRSLIDTVIYRGLSNVSQDISEKIFKEPILQHGMPYESDKASAEISRVITILGNNGYPFAGLDRDSSKAVRYASTNNFMLKYVFNTGQLRTFGEVAVRVNPPREDITDNLAVRELDFKPGDIYSREKMASSESNLNRLDLFETATVDTLSDSTKSAARDSVRSAAMDSSKAASNDTVKSFAVDSTARAIKDSGDIAARTGHTAEHAGPSTPAIPMLVTVHPRPRNELSPEILASDENNAFNLGLGLGYTNHNFFGDARTFSARVRGRTQTIRELFQGKGLRDTTVIGAVSLEFQVLQPYLFTRTLSGSWTSSISAEKLTPYILLSILRNKMGLSNRFATYTYGFFDWTLERINPELLVDTTQFPNAQQQISEANQPQFNSIITFTLQRDKTNDIFSPTSGFFNSISLEESGILPKLFPGFVSGLPFTQYYKVTLFERLYYDLTSTKFNILALKMKGGYQDKYGESRYLPVSIPLNRRFFAGGSGSVRGWKARDLGAMSDEFLQFGGNFILEGSAELRVHHFRGFGKAGFINLENLWAVYFFDFGNVWGDISDFKPKQIAMAAGIGIRYETFFGPFRLDYGFRVYDPKEYPGHQTIFQKQFLGETLTNAVFHIGIGHAF